MEEKIIKPIATIKTPFKEKFGIPRQSGRAPNAIGEIRFVREFNNPDAIRRIEEFSHIWLVFGFSNNPETNNVSVRPPRLGGNERVGVFASRSPFRPNGLGLSVVKLEKVILENNVSLLVSGVDLLDGTPIYDIKPYLPSDKIESAFGGYAEDFVFNKLEVVFSEQLKNLLPPKLVAPIIECLADDPRPSYHEDGRVYGMNYDGYNVKFSVENNTLTVLEIVKQ